jgi:hypothetical protein
VRRFRAFSSARRLYNMWVLYLDESGTHGQARYFVLAGLAVFEREIHWFAQDVDALQQRHFPDSPDPIELHARILFAPDGHVEKPFDQLSKPQRRQLAADMYKIIRGRRGVVFGTAIEKAWCKGKGEEPYDRAFEDLTSRFDLFMRRVNAEAAVRGVEEQRGLIAVAESAYRDNLEVLGERFRGGTTRWGRLHTIADVPFFLPARNTRLLQLADFCAHAVYSRYNSGNTVDFDLIAPRFDREEGKVHGLAHLCADPDCQCLACVSRQTAVR